MCWFYRNYVPNFSENCGPLNSLTKEGIKFKWEEKEQQPFENLKQTMFLLQYCNILILIILSSLKQMQALFIIETEAIKDKEQY